MLLKFPAKRHSVILKSFFESFSFIIQAVILIKSLKFLSFLENSLSLSILFEFYVCFFAFCVCFFWVFRLFFWIFCSFFWICLVYPSKILVTPLSGSLWKHNDVFTLPPDIFRENTPNYSEYTNFPITDAGYTYANFPCTYTNSAMAPTFFCLGCYPSFTSSAVTGFPPFLLVSR